MTATGILVGLVLLIVALFVLGYPLVQQRRSEKRDLAAAIAQKSRDELLTSYERVLATIRDLDEDHQTGKLAPDTYQREREYWTEQGIALLQQLEPDADALPANESAAEPVERPSADKTLDDAIEQAIAEYRKAQVS
jgi:hypothetical protein